MNYYTFGIAAIPSMSERIDNMKKTPIAPEEYIKRTIYSVRVIPLLGDPEVYVLSGTPCDVIAKACKLCTWADSGLGLTYEIVLTEVHSDVV
jgi:hypothetical protein